MTNSTSHKQLSFSQSVHFMADRTMQLLNLDDGTAEAIKNCNSVLQG